MLVRHGHRALAEAAVHCPRRDGPYFGVDSPDSTDAPNDTQAGSTAHSRWARVLQWMHSRDLDEGVSLVIIGALIGAIAGLGVVGFYLLIDASYAALTAWPQRHIPWLGQAILRIAFTSIGVWLAWFIARRARAGEGQNVPDVQLAVARRELDGHLMVREEIERCGRQWDKTDNRHRREQRAHQAQRTDLRHHEAG